MYDVAIIGGGVIGCSIARELSRYRLNTVMVEKSAEVAFGTTKTNSGIIHPGHHSPPEMLKGRLVVRGNAMYDELSKELNFGFRRIGEIVIAREEGDMEKLEAMLKVGQEKGVPGLEIWDQDRLRREEPNLSHSLLGGLYAPTAGVINPYEFAFALIENAMDNGVELRVDSPVLSIERREDGLVLSTPKGDISAKYVLNCAGVFSDHIANLVGVDSFKILPRKGEEYMLDKRLKGLVRHLVFPLPSATSKGTLIIPTFDGTIMVGPTATDTEDRSDVSTTYQGSDQVFGFIRQICPSITERDTITEFAGLRAVSDTNDFIIGPTKVKGFINVAGIQSPGLTAAPAIAEYMREILKDEGLTLEPKPRFKPHVPPPPRFAMLPPEEQQKLIEQNPMFAKVVCRCEMITEAEIHDAIDHGARTLDGVKFRCRAGMGRCQGGFCTSRVMDILSKRLNIPLTEVTKRGGESWIIGPMENEQHPHVGKEN